MTYYDINENRIRRRKVSSNNSHKNQLRQNQRLENTSYTKTLDRREKTKQKNTNEFDEIEKKIFYKKRSKRRARRNKIVKFSIKSFAILFAITCILSSVVVAFSLSGTPKVTKELLESNYINSDIVDINEIPDNLKNAIIATEDRRFYKHNGVEIKSLVRSVINNIFTSSIQGGSTIDMQVSKNLLTSDDKSVKRKIRDIYNAMQMNKVMTKDEILSAYLNNIYFGKSSYGVLKASRAYFGEDVRNLNLAQCAMLAGITNNPARYMQHDEAKRRQKTILYNMYDQGYITYNDYIKAVDDPTPFKSEIAK